MLESDPRAYAVALEAVVAERERELFALRSALAEVTRELERTRRERDLEAERKDSAIVREMAATIQLAEAQKAGDGWRQMAEAGVAAGRA